MTWHDWILNHEGAIRVSFFISILVVMTIWEMLVPRRLLQSSKSVRWTNNLALIILNTLTLRLLFPLAALGFTAYLHQHHLTLLNISHLPVELSIILTIILMDLAIYGQHVLFHYVPIFWRIHKVHHADTDYDVTTGLRFHTFEILLSMLIKFMTIFILGPPVIAVLAFEVLLNATSMFNHGNIKLPLKLDKILRLVTVTPDMHRVHHSVIFKETNSNFGFNLPWWDWIFGTYTAQPRQGHKNMTIGLSNIRNSDDTSKLMGMLLLPFRK